MTKTLRVTLTIFIVAFTLLSTASAQERKVDKAIKDYERGELERAILTLEKTKVEPSDVFYKKYIGIKGLCHYEMRDFDKALEVYDEALEAKSVRWMPESSMLRYMDIKFNKGELDEVLSVCEELKKAKGPSYNRKPFKLIEEMCYFTKDNFDTETTVIGYDSITHIQVWDDLDLGENVISFGGAFYHDSLVFAAYTEYEERSEWELAANEGAVADDEFEVTNLDLYIVPMDKTAPRSLFSKDISTMKNEGALCFNKDFTELYFTRHYVINDKDNFKIHYATPDKNGQWKDQGPLNFCSDKYSFMQPHLSPDGSTLYFTSDKPGGRGNLDIYYAKGIGKKWSQPVNMGAGINTPNDEIFPFLRNDSIMIFSSNGHVGFGGFDLNYVNITEKPYKTKNMMSPINTRFNEYCMIGHNQRRDRVIFFSERGREVGGNEVASILPEMSVNVTPVPYIMDLVELPRPALDVELEIEPSTIPNPNADMQLAAIPEDLGPSLKPVEEKEEVIMPEVIVEELKHLQFQFNSHELVQPAKDILKELPKFLTEHPNVRLVISGHADQIGTEDYNMKLSAERAMETFNYLTTTLELPEDKFVVEANGEYFPLIETQDKEEGKINRRVEFRMFKQDPEEGITMRFKPHDAMPDLVNNLEALFLEHSSGAEVVEDIHEIKVRDLYKAEADIDLAAVAKQYDVSVEKIKEVNNINTNTLLNRQIIMIPLQ